MRILHLFGDHKWTGPAEPTVNLCLRLREMGHDVHFACSPSPTARRDSLEVKARERGLNPIKDIDLNPTLDVFAFLHGVRKAVSYIRQHRIEIVHVHQGCDHVIGGLAARRAGARVRVVRTNHRADPLTKNLRNRFLLAQCTDGLIEISTKATEADRTASGLRAELVGHIEGTVDLNRFAPSRSFPDIRPRFGMDKQTVVVGVVARLQRHRKFDLFLRAMKIASQAMPEVRALVLGRGTFMNEVGVEPARQMGIGDKVVFAGYLGEDYEAALAAFDMEVFLVPGSDGSCRAVLEAMAMGKPVIAAKRGVLPEIIEHERTGILVNDDAEELARWILRLAGHPAMRRALGAAARAEAERRFTIRTQAEAICRVYENVLASESSL